MWIAYLILFVALAGIAYEEFRLYREDCAVLRHTISVNLSILSSELVELQRIADVSTTSKEVERARHLLSFASTLSAGASEELNSATRKELRLMLGRVFRAMMHSAEARRLLGACSK